MQETWNVNVRVVLVDVQKVKGVPPLREGINPATWMLEVSTLSKEDELGVDFADIYRNSDLYRYGQPVCLQPVPMGSVAAVPSRLIYRRVTAQQRILL